MFDDGNRMGQFHQQALDAACDRVEEFRRSNPCPAPGQIAEIAKRAIEDFWMLHAGIRSKVRIVKHELDPRKED